LVYFPLSLFTADLSFGCGCLLASPAWLVGLSAQESESGLPREVAAQGCEIFFVTSGLFSPEFDASFGGGSAPAVDREVAQDGDVVRAVATSTARVVVFEKGRD
jgi:hypothetical protein